MLRLVIEAISITPVDVPQRATRARIAWKSGSVTDLLVDRPEHGRLTPQLARQRVRELSRLGLPDAQIADRLNVEGLQTGAKRPWKAWAVARVRTRERIASSAPRERPSLVPDQMNRAGTQRAVQLAISASVCTSCAVGFDKGAPPSAANPTAPTTTSFVSVQATAS